MALLTFIDLSSRQIFFVLPLVIACVYTVYNCITNPNLTSMERLNLATSYLTFPCSRLCVLFIL
jgi:hypothetical protein